MHHIYQKVVLQGTTSGLACGRGKLSNSPQPCTLLEAPTHKALFFFSLVLGWVSKTTSKDFYVETSSALNNVQLHMLRKRDVCHNFKQM